MELIEKWIEAEAELKRLKALESQLRDDVYKEYFGRQNLEGTHTKKVSDTCTLSATVKNNVKFDKGIYNQYLNDLVKAASVVTVTFSKSKFDALSAKEQRDLAPLLTYTPAKTTLKIKEK